MIAMIYAMITMMTMVTTKQELGGEFTFVYLKISEKQKHEKVYDESNLVPNIANVPAIRAGIGVLRIIRLIITQV